MKHIIKAFGLLSVFAVFSGADAATSRASVTGAVSPRLPSIAGHIVNTGTTTTTTSTASYLDNSDCIEKYTDCIKADDVCGSDMSECTTNVLFHGQMAKCSSVLYQCSSSGITALFGIGNISSLGACQTNSNGDIASCTYPSDGSVLGQLITGAKISNQLSTEQCVKSYTRCLQREGNCGADFELCTTKKEFKKQALLCDSTLQRCQSDGKIQLFGSVQNADSLAPADETRVGQLIADGQSTAATNAVKTCQKVTDNCLISACTKNPLRCVEGVSMATIGAADFVTGSNELSGTTSNTQNLVTGYNDNYLESQTGSDIRKMLKAQCLETIGANKYCHMTYREKSPANKELMDIDLQEDVFSLAYAARKDAVNTKIQEAVKKFDTKAKDACVETIKSCAMRSCGGGIGSVCFKLARGDVLPVTNLFQTAYDDSVHVNRSATYGDIKSGCSAIVNADANCIYAATSGGTDGYQYAYTDANTFTTLFPEYTGSETDTIGAISKLNSILATSYNDAAIEEMKKKCQTVALSCVKSMCGKDFVNCYRNRTDIVLADNGAYNTGNGSLDRSMNKVGGVLDYNIVMGLCMNNVKSSSVCEEHLKVATAEWRNSSDANAWDGANTVREAWLGANTTTVNTTANSNSVVIACSASTTTTANGGDCSGTMEPVNGACVGIMDEDGCVYDTSVTQSNAEYALDNGARTLFQTMLVDVEKEAQAKYNAKLTKEQNVCLANNNGGIMGSQGQNGSTFQWVKLRSSKIPKNYAMQGLKENQFIASNDLYGSFCRMRVTIQSDDKDIQDNLGEDAIAYFAVGDAFTCGSWISQKTLDKITKKVAERALIDEGLKVRKENGKLRNSNKANWELWGSSAGAALLSGIGGFVATDALQRNGASLGGLLSGNGISATKDKKEAAEECFEYVDKASKEVLSVNQTAEAESMKQLSKAIDYANKAKSAARRAGQDVSDIEFVNFVGSAGTYHWNLTMRNNVQKIMTDKIDNTDPNKENKNAAKNAAKNADDYMNKNKPQNAYDYGDLTTLLSELVTKCQDENIDSFCSFTYDTATLIESDGNGVAGASLTDFDNVIKNFATNLKELEKKCSAKAGENSDSKLSKNLAGAAITGALGGGITWTAIKASQKIKQEGIQNEAVQEWMNEIGDHIECYVGTESVGSYGDVVALEID